jgi:hypothetical protein
MEGSPVIASLLRCAAKAEVRETRSLALKLQMEKHLNVCSSAYCKEAVILHICLVRGVLRAGKSLITFRAKFQHTMHDESTSGKFKDFELNLLVSVRNI